MSNEIAVTSYTERFLKENPKGVIDIVAMGYYGGYKGLPTNFVVNYSPYISFALNNLSLIVAQASNDGRTKMVFRDIALAFSTAIDIYSKVSNVTSFTYQSHLIETGQMKASLPILQAADMLIDPNVATFDINTYVKANEYVRLGISLVQSYLMVYVNQLLTKLVSTLIAQISAQAATRVATSSTWVGWIIQGILDTVNYIRTKGQVEDMEKKVSKQLSRFETVYNTSNLNSLLTNSFIACAGMYQSIIEVLMTAVEGETKEYVKKDFIPSSFNSILSPKAIVKYIATYISFLSVSDTEWEYFDSFLQFYSIADYIKKFSPDMFETDEALITEALLANNHSALTMYYTNLKVLENQLNNIYNAVIKNSIYGDNKRIKDFKIVDDIKELSIVIAGLAKRIETKNIEFQLNKPEIPKVTKENITSIVQKFFTDLNLGSLLSQYIDTYNRQALSLPNAKNGLYDGIPNYDTSLNTDYLYNNYNFRTKLIERLYPSFEKVFNIFVNNLSIEKYITLLSVLIFNSENPNTVNTSLYLYKKYEEIYELKKLMNIVDYIFECNESVPKNFYTGYQNTHLRYAVRNYNGNNYLISNTYYGYVQAETYGIGRYQEPAEYGILYHEQYPYVYYKSSKIGYSSNINFSNFLNAVSTRQKTIYNNFFPIYDINILPDYIWQGYGDSGQQEMLNRVKGLPIIAVKQKANPIGIMYDYNVYQYPLGDALIYNPFMVNPVAQESYYGYFIPQNFYTPMQLSYTYVLMSSKNVYDKFMDNAHLSGLGVWQRFEYNRGMYDTEEQGENYRSLETACKVMTRDYDKLVFYGEKARYKNKDFKKFYDYSFVKLLQEHIRNNGYTFIDKLSIFMDITENNYHLIDSMLYIEDLKTVLTFLYNEKTTALTNDLTIYKAEYSALKSLNSTPLEILYANISLEVFALIISNIGYLKEKNILFSLNNLQEFNNDCEYIYNGRTIISGVINLFDYLYFSFNFALAYKVTMYYNELYLNILLGIAGDEFNDGINKVVLDYNVRNEFTAEEILKDETVNRIVENFTVIFDTYKDYGDVYDIVKALFMSAEDLENEKDNEGLTDANNNIKVQQSDFSLALLFTTIGIYGIN